MKKDTRIPRNDPEYRDGFRDHFTFNGVEYISAFLPLDDKYSADWVVAVVIPLDKFTADFTNAQIYALVISGIIFVLSIVLIFYVSKRISQPIAQLTKEANKITNFDLDEEIKLDTTVDEIQGMRDSLTSMKNSMRSFGKFVPLTLVKQLVKRGTDIKLGGKERQVTIMFTDIKNFTAVSEKFSPDKLMIHISEYFEELTNVIMEHKGVIDKYIGDAIMAFWGAPHTDKDQIYNACVAAIACKKKLVELNRKWSLEDKPRFETRFGIHTGNVIVGNMGSTERMNYTVIGDNVNLAARLESVNKQYGTSILVSEAVYLALKERCIFRPVDKVRVKGKERPETIYELIGVLKGDPALIPSSNDRQFAEAFTVGFKLFHESRWEEALAHFEKMKNRFAADDTMTLYIRRCRDFVKSPPGIDWDGTVTLTEK